MCKIISPASCKSQFQSRCNELFRRPCHPSCLLKSPEFLFLFELVFFAFQTWSTGDCVRHRWILPTSYSSGTDQVRKKSNSFTIFPTPTTLPKWEMSCCVLLWKEMWEILYLKLQSCKVLQRPSQMPSASDIMPALTTPPDNFKSEKYEQSGRW